MERSELEAQVMAGRRLFHNVVLFKADLDGIDLSSELGGERVEFSFIGANLIAATMRGASLRYMRLIGANLAEADLTEADLTGANLEGANLYKADLTDANLERANLEGANLHGTKGVFDPEVIVNAAVAMYDGSGGGIGDLKRAAKEFIKREKRYRIYKMMAGSHITDWPSLFETPDDAARWAVGKDLAADLGLHEYLVVKDEALEKIVKYL